MTALTPIAETEEQLRDLVAHHTGTVTGTLTPACASWILKLNTSNRPLVRNGIERFSSIARAGEWRLTGEAIVIAREGLLNDGQHRCHAVVDTGISVPVDVRFGALRDAFQCTGTGRRRTAAQTLHVIGIQYGAMVGSVARLIALHDAGKLSDGSVHIENAVIASVAQAEPNILALVKAVHVDFRPVKAAAFAFPMVLAARVASIETVLQFIDLVATGLTPTPHDASRTLHLRLMEAHMKKHRLKQIVIATLTARAWNAWIAGQEIRKLKVLSDDETGRNFPKVIGPPETAE